MTGLSFGVLGFGRHAEKILAAFSRCRESRVVAIGTTSDDKQRDLTKKFPEIRVCSYDKLLESPETQAIYIALPNHLHTDWILRALHAGKHVICEKPLCVRAEELEKLSSALASATPLFHLGFMYRFHPQHTWVKQFLAAGKLGAPYLFEAHFHYSLRDTTNIRHQVAAGGGGLLDVGCYLFDCAEFLFGARPQSINGNWNIDEHTKVDVSAHLQVRYEHQLTAHLNCGMNLARANTYSIFGSEGTLTVRNAFRVEPNQKTIIEWSKLDGSSELVQFPGLDQNAIQFDAFARLVKKQSLPGESSLFTNGLKNMSALLAAREACTTGRTISMDPHQ